MCHNIDKSLLFVSMLQYTSGMLRRMGMSQKKTRKKKWKLGLALAAVFSLVFAVFFAAWQHNEAQAAEYTFLDSSGNQINSGGEFTMRRATDTYTLLGIQSNDVCTWTSTNTDIAKFEGAAADGTKVGPSAVIKAINNGTVAITVEIKHADGTADTVTMTLDVVFSISEYLNGVSGVNLSKIYPEDERKSLIMNYDTSVSIGDGDAGNNFLKLTFGDGTKAEWVCANTDVIRFSPGAGSDAPKIQAVGAGPTTLTVSWTEGTNTYTDTINVYVRPQIKSADGNTILAGSANSPNTVEVKNGDMVQVTIENDANPQIAIADKLVWVISKGSGENSVLVRDSLGNHGDGWEDINLYYVRSGKQHFYRVDAKSGEYNVQFYVKGVYRSFDESKTNAPVCGPVNLLTKVDCDFVDKDVTISLGGTYNLSDAFNIPLDVLKQYFTATIIDKNGSASATYISLDEAIMEVATKQLGHGYLSVALNSGVNPDGIIPGFPTDHNSVIVTVTVADGFTLNIVETMMSEGSTLDLHGIIASDAVAEASQFKWSVSDENFLELSSSEGQYVTVTARRETPANSPARVTLAWTDTQGVTWVSTCKITVIKAPTNFNIKEENVTIEAGQTVTLHTNIDKKNANIDWLSSDTSLMTVQANDGNISAEVTATDKVGSAVITAYNRDNGTYATCVVTVTAPITDISIVQGEEYVTTMANPFVFMKATYLPENATNTELVWSLVNDDPNRDDVIATIEEETGVLTLVTEGTVIIYVEPKHNPNKVSARCRLTIKEDPVTKINTDVSELDMIKGDVYQVATTIEPENPSDSTLTWSVVMGEDVVSVDQTGAISALGVGTATVLVEGVNHSGKPAQAYIKVNVRDRLLSIKFEETNVEVPEKGTYQLKVLFDPDENVNKTLHFRSSDTDVVTVDESTGLITGVKDGGLAVITCWADDIGPQEVISCLVRVTGEVIPATGFEISPTSQTIQIGKSFNIVPSFQPENTSDKNILYESMDSSIAKVEANGKVTGMKAGVTVITCTPVQNVGDIKAKTCTVTVIPGVKLSLSPSSREIAVGKSFTIKKIVTPAAADKTAKWTTSNKKIATVSSSGKVKAKKIGTCRITCTLTKYNISATCTVKVAKLRSTLKLNKRSIRINIGQTYKLKKTVWTNNTKKPGVRFTSKNKRIATVGKTSGKVKGKRVGSTVITAKTTDKKATAKCRVTVIRRITSIRLNKTYGVCYIGRTMKLKATVRPKKASIKKLKWTSSNTKVATVLSNGTVTGISEGSVYITAKATDGSNKSARCYVSVIEPVPASSIVVAQSELTMKRGDSAKLAYTTLPDNHSDSIKFASDNTRVVKVTKTGTVKAVGTGTATVTITATSGVTSTVTVNVVSLNKTSVRMRQYDTETLTVIGTSANITWYSANNRIASVENGRITGRGIGTTYVYAYVNGCKMACKVQIVSVNNKKR